MRLATERLRGVLWERLILPLAAWRARRRFERWRRAGRLPRVAMVKQDCNEDLYCCEPGAPALETVRSTLLRSGPVALLTAFKARFVIVGTEADPECNIWKEKWDPLRWCPVEWFESFRDLVPGRDHGQSRFAQSVESIDWDAFDLIVSFDVSVPARVTLAHSRLVWSYYVRELKAPSWSSSFDAPIHGQDLYLSQQFAPHGNRKAPHVLAFPYHFHYYGIFHELTGRILPTSGDGNLRSGVFVEYHTAREATAEQLRRLEEFGPVYAKTPDDDRFDLVAGKAIPSRSMEADALSALMSSKYHVKWGGRKVLGTAKVEAIAAGCLALSDPAGDGTPFFQSEALSASGFEALFECIRRLEASPGLYQREVARQRRLLNYLCFHRPANELLDAWQRIRKRKLKSLEGASA